tara:strand:+ start:1650 stop:3437 length:1788 start_codon:yes stop_codon:yes gene_type:complete
MPAITGTVLMNMGKQLLKNMAKKAVKATVKKKKVKGKDVAKKMMGKEEKGGALSLQPKADLVPSSGGSIDLVKPKETGGEIVKVSGTAAKDLGLTPFMESLTKIQTNVDAIKAAINDNNKDTIDRIEDQRLLNAKLKKEQREKDLESKEPGIGQKMLSTVKDPAEDFLTKMARFATMTLLGSLIAALMGGARDVILAFRIGIEAVKKGLPTLLKGVKALKAGIGKAFSLALRPFKSLGNLIFKGFKALGSKLFGMVKGAIAWVDDAIKGIVRAGAKAFPKAAQMVAKTTKAAGTIINQGKTFVKNTASKAKGLVKGVASKAKGLVKGGVGKVSKFITKLFGKNVAKAVGGPAGKSIFKSLAKGAKAIKIPVIGPLLVAITSMFSGDPVGKTLFKTAGAAIGGGLGLALGPIGMIVGEIAGEFVGDVLYEGFRGEDGWAGAGKKLKDKFFQIVKGGKAFTKWIGSGFSRFIENFKAENKTRLGVTNWLNILNPAKTLPLLGKSFFPPSEEGSSEGGDTAASIGEQSSSVDVESISESASYEDGGEEPTVVIGGGGQQAASPTPQAGKTKFISLGLDKQTVLNSQYEMSSNAALYKV